MLTGLLFGLVSALSFGTADFLAGLSSRKIGVFATLYFMQAVGFVFLSVNVIGVWGVARMVGSP